MPEESQHAQENFQVAVLLPCHNEERTIANVVRDFHAALPGAHCYVYDNASTDGTAAAARAAGATVRFERMLGKGNVVRRMFADIEADIYVLADGDDTVDASVAPAMVNKLIDHDIDMVVGIRVALAGQNPHRRGHVLGNALLGWLIKTQFGGAFSDISSGYRVFSRRLVKSFPAMSRQFEIEPELDVHCADLRLPFAEMPTTLTERPSGSESKLRTLRDGMRALFTIGILVKEVHPFRFFSASSVVLALVSVVLAAPIVATFFETSLVPRLPTALLCVGLMLMACGSFLAGLILDSISRGRREQKRMAYLRHPSIQALMSKYALRDSNGNLANVAAGRCATKAPS